MKAIKGLISVLLLLGVVVALLLGGMRFSDGPVGMLSGGAFSSGEARPSLSQFGFLEGREVIEFQTSEPETSRTIWLVVENDRLYFVSGYMNTLVGKVWKHWPKHIEQNNRVTVRADGGLYPQQLQRLKTAAEIPAVMRKFSGKYGLGSEGMSDDAIFEMVARGDVWLYEVVSL